MTDQLQRDEGTAAGQSVRQLIYVSTTTRGGGKAEMDALLAQSRRDNQRRGLTGMLLYKDGHFMQALEGDPAIVAATYESIRRDPRHRDLIKVLDRICNARDFADWSMGYRRLKPEEAPGEGFNDILLQSADPVEDAPLALRFLKRFADNIR